MGLKERVYSARGKTLMTSFFIAETLDTVMTKASLSYFGGTEISPLGGAELLNNFGMDQSLVLKTGIIAILIGSYALASIHDSKLKIKSSEVKTKYVLEKALQNANIFAWGVVAWNTANITPDIVVKLASGKT